MKTTSEHGFVALISVLILSAVLLATTLSLAQFGIANRFFVLNLEQKTVSEKLAEACVHIARIQAYNDPAYESNEARTVSVAGDTCTIVAMSVDDDETMIRARALSGEAITNLEVIVDSETGNFVSWREVPGF